MLDKDVCTQCLLSHIKGKTTYDEMYLKTFEEHWSMGNVWCLPMDELLTKNKIYKRCTNAI